MNNVIRYIAVSAILISPILLANQGFSQELPKLGSAGPSIPKEPGWSHPSYRGWDLLGITGLISTYYDLNRDGDLDYMVLRKILRKRAAEDTSVEEAIETARRDHMSVYISYPVIYFTQKYPLFYCLGVDYRRICRVIWVDIEEDGLNGNEKLYTLATPGLNVR